MIIDVGSTAWRCWLICSLHNCLLSLSPVWRLEDIGKDRHFSVRLIGLRLMTQCKLLPLCVLIEKVKFLLLFYTCISLFRSFIEVIDPFISRYCWALHTVYFLHRLFIFTKVKRFFIIIFFRIVLCIRSRLWFCVDYAIVYSLLTAIR